MIRRLSFVPLMMLVAPLLAVSAEEPAAPLARRVWVITEAVLRNHIQPPSREAMLLAATKALLAKAGTTAPEDLSRRVAEVATADDLAALFQGFWPPSDKVSADDLQKATVEALLKSLPGGGHLMDATEERVAEQVNANRYVGIGIQIAKPEGEKFSRIQLPFARGPAHRAGGRPGDLILSVNGVSMEGVPLREVVEAIRGPEGTACVMEVRQPDEKDARTLQMTRGVVPFETILGYRRLDDERWDFRPQGELPIAYVRVGSMTSSCLHELRQIEPKLQAEGCRALVLDLRWSGGSTVANAALLADGLLDGGVLWRTTNLKKQTREYTADRDCLFRGWPVAVLVNDPMPPGAILVAAALQDNRRAILVGETKSTEHAGFLREPVRLPDSQGTLLIYTGRVTRPSGDWTLRPNHVAGLPAGHLKAVQQWNARQDQPKGNAGEKPPEDPQLARAVEILKAELDKTTATPGTR
jgi:carboxyl-terminal processing protease